MSDRAIPPADITPAAFFTEWVPARVAADSERQRKLGDADVVLVFYLDDPAGEVGGAYSLHVEEGHVRGEVADSAAADLRVHTDLATWRALNAGALSAPEAFMKKRVRLQGDLRLAVKLHLIIG